MEKTEIRKNIKTKRAALTEDEILEKSLSVQDSLFGLNDFGEAGVVCCYVALRDEVQTRSIIEKCWSDLKSVCVPARREDAVEYDLADMTKETVMAEGPMRVLEPKDKDWVSISTVDLIIVPGLAFDSECNRVGYGGGNYDRIMSATDERTRKIGLAFEFQIVDGLPVSVHDVRLDMVITEKRIIRCA